MDPAALLRTLQVALGIGMVIFVHEAGHFLAARWCGVRVEVFSLGFGPPLLSFRRGSTTYQLALVPFGGYVRMAGEGALPGTTPAPDELGAKSVGARFFVYSGGVLMNLVFALVAFPVAYSFGVPITRPVIGTPVPGGGAWAAGIPAGSELLEVGGSPLRDFEDLVGAVALNGARAVEVTYRSPEGAVRTTRVDPDRDDDLGFYRIGVRVGSDPEGRLLVAEEGPASQAGLRTGDRLQRVVGMPATLTLAEQLSLAVELEQPLVLEVLDEEGDLRQVTLEPSWSEVPERLLFGVGPAGATIVAVRPRGVAQGLGLRAGDRLLACGPRPIHAARDLRGALLTEGPMTELQVERDGEVLSIALPASLDDRALLSSDLELPAEMESARVWVDPRGAASRAGLPSGATLLELDGVPVTRWEEIQARCGRAVQAGASLTVLARAPGAKEPATWTLTAAPAQARDLGFDLAPPDGVYRTEGLAAALLEGVRASGRFLVHTGLTLKRMATQEVSTKNLGGIITISRVSYRVSSMGWTKLLFFLCILSVNLAFLNVLPIPVLDGGHLFFLLVERLKGSPVSARTLGYSQMVGMVLIVTLMVYVTYNDLLRWIGS